MQAREVLECYKQHLRDAFGESSEDKNNSGRNADSEVLGQKASGGKSTSLVIGQVVICIMLFIKLVYILLRFFRKLRVKISD